MPIERIDVFVVDFPGRLQRRMYGGGTYDTGPVGAVLGKPVLVKLTADGVVGYGQIRAISPGHFVSETAHSMVAAISEVYGPYLLGKNLSDLEPIWDGFDKLLPGNPAARAALDIAMHDALGKLYQVPVYELVGGLCQPQVPLEWSVSFDDDTARMVDDAQRAIEEFGITVLCLKAASIHGWRRDVESFRTVRRAVGDDVVIGIDPNTGWAVHESILAMDALNDEGLGYLEQPVDRRDLTGLKRIREEARGVPIMADESVFSVRDAFDLAQRAAVDVFCIKLYKHGGIHAAQKIAAVAQASNIRINAGGLAAYSQLEAAAACHFYASIPVERTMPAAEFIFGLGVIGPDPLVPETDFVIRDGSTKPPDGPGLGVVIDEDAVWRHSLRHVQIQGS